MPTTRSGGRRLKSAKARNRGGDLVRGARHLGVGDLAIKGYWSQASTQ
jgi:hypothetical protein